MNKFCVQRLEVHRQDLIVTAENAEEALEIAKQDEDNDACVWGEMSYDYTLEPDIWPIFEIK